MRSTSVSHRRAAARSARPGTSSHANAHAPSNARLDLRPATAGGTTPTRSPSFKPDARTTGLPRTPHAHAALALGAGLVLPVVGGIPLAVVATLWPSLGIDAHPNPTRLGALWVASVAVGLLALLAGAFLFSRLAAREGASERA